MKLPLLLSSALILTACGSQQSRVYKKQRSESDIKVSYLNLQTGMIKTRFQYQSYVDKTLEKIDCDLELNSTIKLSLSNEPNIGLGAFSTEIISFQSNELKNITELTGENSIQYNLNCQITYDKGGEYLKESSALHLSPNSIKLYR